MHIISSLLSDDYYAQPQKVAGYYVIPSKLLSVRPSIRPSMVDNSCPLHNFDTVQDNFTKLGTNIKHDQTTCREINNRHSTYIFAELFPFENSV